MTTSVTPKGVEHTDGDALMRAICEVTTSVTPKGVEHLECGLIKDVTPDVTTSVTPKGVEHPVRNALSARVAK